MNEKLQQFLVTGSSFAVPALVGAAEHSIAGLVVGGMAAILTYRHFPDVYESMRKALPMLPETPLKEEKPEVPQVIEPVQQEERLSFDEVIPKDDTQQLPKKIAYDEIKMLIPRNHVLVGVSEYNSVVTREQAIKGLVWVVGGSGSGKSNTVALRVQEDYERDHRFLGIDPHAFKDDSLTNATHPYHDRFLLPIARQPEDILHVLQAFLTEFERRKQGSPCYPITLLVDEVGSLTMDKPEDEIEEQIIAKIKQVARIAGQETRGFNMGVTMISQDAAYLSWLRKRALMVLGHKVMMMSERELVCNRNMDIARDMDNWPVGRTVVYGIAFQGVHVLQQPYISPPTSIMPSIDELRRSYGSNAEVRREAAGSNMEVHGSAVEVDAQKKFLVDIGRRLRNGESSHDILKSLGITGGRAYQEMSRTVEMIAEEI